MAVIRITLRQAASRAIASAAMIAELKFGHDQMS
jgi:hypothetical protein